MNRSLARLVFERGARVRNPSLFRLYDELKATEWNSVEQLTELQTKRAQALLCHAGANSPYFKKLFQERGFAPENFSGVGDLSVLPELSKSDLITHNKRIHTSGNNEPMFLAETSGTSGVSLSFNRNESWDSLNRATMMRAYDWYDVKPWDRNGYLWGYNITTSQRLKVKLLDALQNRFRLFDYSRTEIERFASLLSSASFISGYSSMVYEVAKCINECGIDTPTLKLVKGTSEMILDVYHKESIAAFGRKVTSEYGAAEAGLIAFECPMGSMHINIENVILELNENQEVLVTNLASSSFPIIRYNLGDAISLSDNSCPCGRAHPVIDTIQGRKGSNVIGAEKKYPALTFYYVFKNIALQHDMLLNYKAVQKNKGEAEILVEGAPSSQVTAKIREQLDCYFGDDISFDIRFVDGFDSGQKKRQYFESMIEEQRSTSTEA